MNQFTITTTRNKGTPSVFSNYCGAQQQKLTIDIHATQQHLRNLLTEGCMWRPNMWEGWKGRKQWQVKGLRAVISKGREWIANMTGWTGRMCSQMYACMNVNNEVVNKIIIGTCLEAWLLLLQKNYKLSLRYFSSGQCMKNAFVAITCRSNHFLKREDIDGDLDTARN